MFGDILGAILSPSPENKLIASIHQQNQQLEQELFTLNSKLEELPIDDILSQMKNNQYAKSPTFVHESHHEQILRTVELYYSFLYSDQKQGQQCQNLIQQLQIIKTIAAQLNLVDTIALWNSAPQSQVLQFLKSLITRLDDEVMGYRNKQNRNSFEAEEDGFCQEYTKVLSFLTAFRQVTGKIFNSVLESTYSFKNGICELDQYYFSQIWKEEKQHKDRFLTQLQEYFSNFITYDVNFRQYTLLIYQTTQNQSTVKIQQLSKIMFESHEVALHYDSLTQTIQNYIKFIGFLQKLIPSHHQSQTTLTLRKVTSTIKEYFEYLVPYLNMERRKALWALLPFGQAGSESTVYDLLVGLKMKGQDANSMVESINHIVSKMQKQKESTKIVLDFLQLGKGSSRNYNTIMFLCDQLVQGLQQSSSIDTAKMKTIRQLLMIREQMRLKIHSIQD